MAKPKFPFKIRSGGSVVTVYKMTIGGRVRFQVRWHEKGQAERQTFSDFESAEVNGRLTVDRLAAGEVGAMTLNAERAAAYRRAVAICGDTPLEVACQEWARAKLVLNGASILQVAADHAKRTVGAPIDVASLIKRFVADRKADGVSRVYIERIEYRLDKVETAFGPRKLREISELEIRRFVETQGGSPRNRKNMRDALVTLWRFARREGFLPRDLRTEAEMVDTPVIRRQAQIAIFSPDEMRKLLNAAPDNIRPALAICGFAGVRSQGEISRLQWANVRFGQSVIEVTESKTGLRRLIPLSPNLRAWLEPFSERTGPIIELIPDKAFRRIATKVDVKWRHNALRHSYGSYRVAHVKSVDQVALEMGNSGVIVRRHYLEAVHGDEATAWFGIMPG